MNEEHVFDLIAAYALGCLGPGEKDRVDIHLARCSICKEELMAYQAVVDSLAYSPKQVEPPTYLKSVVIKATQGPVHGLAAKPATGLFQKATEKSDHSTLKRTPRLAWTRTLLPVWGVVSLIAILILGVANVMLYQQVQKVSQPGTVVLSEFRIVPLSGTDSAPKATGILVISQDGMAGSLTVDGLQPLDTAHQYQLWLIVQGQRTNGGVFSVDKAGYGSLKINSSRPLIDYQTFGITIEPSGGSPGPTGNKVLGGSL